MYVYVYVCVCVCVHVVCRGGSRDSRRGGHTYKMGVVRRAVDAVVCARASLVPRPLRICRLQYGAQKPENEATYIEHAQSGL